MLRCSEEGGVRVCDDNNDNGNNVTQRAGHLPEAARPEKAGVRCLLNPFTPGQKETSHRRRFVTPGMN